MCPGIENYSRHIDGRKEGQRPYTLIDYFPKDFLMIVDESHVMLPQVRGMYNGDRSRKETLVEYLSLIHISLLSPDIVLHSFLTLKMLLFHCIFQTVLLSLLYCFYAVSYTHLNVSFKSYYQI